MNMVYAQVAVINIANYAEKYAQHKNNFHSPRRGFSAFSSDNSNMRTALRGIGALRSTAKVSATNVSESDAESTSLYGRPRGLITLENNSDNISAGMPTNLRAESLQRP